MRPSKDGRIKGPPYCKYVRTHESTERNHGWGNTAPVGTVVINRSNTREHQPMTPMVYIAIVSRFVCLTPTELPIR